MPRLTLIQGKLLAEPIEYWSVSVSVLCFMYSFVLLNLNICKQHFGIQCRSRTGNYYFKMSIFVGILKFITGTNDTFCCSKR